MQKKYTPEQALAKLAEIITAQKIADEKAIAEQKKAYADIASGNIDLAESNENSELDVEIFTDSEEIRTQMIEYVHLYVALNATAPDALDIIDYLDLIAKQDYPDSPYRHILAYQNTIQTKADMICPRNIFFAAGLGAHVDYMVSKLS